MSKLHELLAVEQNLRGQAMKVAKDLMHTFADKRHLFTELKKTFISNEQDVPDKIEEETTLQTEIRKELKWLSGKLAPAFDVGHQVDVANTIAKGDVYIGDTPFLKEMPATSLLQLEKFLGGVKDVIMSIPTLDPAKGFSIDPDRGEAIYKAKDIRKTRTLKRWDYKIMVPATKEHPAQIKELTHDVPAGEILQQEWSSLITPAEKSEMIDRVEELTRAVKKARSRANEQAVDTKQNRAGMKILDYVFEGKR